MQINTQYAAFLKSIKTQSSGSKSVAIDAKLQPLAHHFWTYSEIKNSLSLRQDWEVNADLIPFYGNWHDLICVNQLTGEVIMLDDDRNVIASWHNSAAFMRDLSDEIVECEPLADATVLSIWLSPDFADKFKKYKK